MLPYSILAGVIGPGTQIEKKNYETSFAVSQPPRDNEKKGKSIVVSLLGQRKKMRNNAELHLQEILHDN